jgi:hypothetical protein
MSSDLQRLMRAVKIIAELAWKYHTEDVAAAMMKHCSRRERDKAAFVGTFLDNIFQLNHKAESEAEPRCCECGGNIFDAKGTSLGRADARYCSQVCRQRAYRKRRVTVLHSGGHQRRHTAPLCDASHIERVGHPSPLGVALDRLLEEGL